MGTTSGQRRTRRARVVAVIIAMVGATLATGTIGAPEAQAAARTSATGWSTTTITAPQYYSVPVNVGVVTGTAHVARTVTVQRKAASTTTWSTVSTGSTDAQGHYRALLPIPAIATFQFRLVVRATPTASAFTTPIRTVKGVAGTPTTITGFGSPGGSPLVTVGGSRAVTARVRTGAGYPVRTVQVLRTPLTNGVARQTVIATGTTDTKGYYTAHLVVPATGVWLYSLNVAPTATAARAWTGLESATGVDIVVTGRSPASGTTGGGTEVALTGTGLSRVTGVTFAGAAARVLPGGTDNELHVITPPHAPGSVVVQVLPSLGSARRTTFNYVGVSDYIKGYSHACARLTTATTKCWGDNSAGELGVTGITKADSPVASPASSLHGLTAGNRFTCGITDTGGARCWGTNDRGQLGVGPQTGTVQTDPLDVPGLGSGVVSIRASGTFACALRADGTVWCWGQNSSGQLGDGTRSAQEGPVQVTGLAAARQISVGAAHACAVTTSDALFCWGDSYYGQLGTGLIAGKTATTSSLIPRTPTGLGSGVASVSAAADQTCALLTSGSVSCFGRNNSMPGGLFNGVAVPTPVPQAVGAVSITAGATSACALTATSAVLCWGYNTNGELGIGVRGGYYESAQQVHGLGPGSTASLPTSLCALSPTGALRCWGDTRLSDPTVPTVVQLA